MKKLLLPMLSLLLFSLSSCDNDDDKKSNDPLLHQWTLVNVSGGFAGTDYTFAEGLIRWRFKADGSVLISNNNIDENKPDGIDSGSYQFTVKDNTSQIEGCSKSMDIDTYTFSCYNIDTNGKLILDDSPIDGMKYTFLRADLIP